MASAAAFVDFQHGTCSEVKTSALNFIFVMFSFITRCSLLHFAYSSYHHLAQSAGLVFHVICHSFASHSLICGHSFFVCGFSHTSIATSHCCCYHSFESSSRIDDAVKLP